MCACIQDADEAKVVVAITDNPQSLPYRLASSPPASRFCNLQAIREDNEPVMKTRQEKVQKEQARAVAGFLKSHK